MTEPLETDFLGQFGALPEDPSEVQLEDWLTEVADQVEEMDPGHRALVREAVINRLDTVESIRAPARVADAFLPQSSPDGAGKASQGSTLALEDPEPWPESVDGAALIEELVDAFDTYLALPDGAAVALALWTLHAHAHDASPVSPVLAITSPEKRCGKTTLLELLSALVPRALPASNLTAATVFRTVEEWQPTLLVDEADTFLAEGTTLRGVLNSGHRRSLAYVPRCVGDGNEVRQFRTWAPKAVALIGQLPDTLADRSIEVRMRRRAPDEEVARLRLDQVEKEMEPVCRRACRWTRDCLDTLATADPEIPQGLDDRERDNWRPLLAIVDMAGGPWPERAREAAVRLSGEGQDDRSLGTRLLGDVRRILEAHPSDSIRSKVLVNKLCQMEEAPWREYKGKGLSAVSLANFLRSFDVSSKQIRFQSGSYKGYEVSAFEDAFRRYLPAKAKQAKQPGHDRDSDGFSTRNTEADVSPSVSAERPNATTDVSDVSARREADSEGDLELPELPF